MANWKSIFSAPSLKYGTAFFIALASCVVLAGAEFKVFGLNDLPFVRGIAFVVLIAAGCLLLLRGSRRVAGWLTRALTRLRMRIASAAIFLVIAFSTAIFLVFYIDHFVDSKNTPLIGAVIGSFLGVAASTFIWLLTHWQKAQESENAKEAFRKLLWIDLGSLQDTVYREAQWWKDESQDTRFGATEYRLISHVQAGVLEANLDRITDVPTRVADALLALRADLFVLHDSLKMFYLVEDKLITDKEKGSVTLEFAQEKMRSNKQQIFQRMLRVAARVRQACTMLEFEQFVIERRASFADTDWCKRENSEREMNAVLDTFRIQHLGG